MRFGASEATLDGLDGDVAVSLTGQCVDLAESGHALRVAKGFGRQGDALTVQQNDQNAVLEYPTAFSL